MPLRIKPYEYLEPLLVGEDEEYTIDCSDQLGNDTVKTVSIVYTDEDGDAVTSNFAKGDSESSGVITFGLNAYAVGTYTITFDITCDQKLPDDSTERNFKFKMYLTVE